MQQHLSATSKFVRLDSTHPYQQNSQPHNFLPACKCIRLLYSPCRMKCMWWSLKKKNLS